MHTVIVLALVLSAASVAECVAWPLFGVRAWKEWRRSPEVRDGLGTPPPSLTPRFSRRHSPVADRSLPFARG